MWFRFRCRNNYFQGVKVLILWFYRKYFSILFFVLLLY